MLDIKRIFYQTRGIANESHSIERSLLLLKELDAYLDIYVIYDKLPGEIEDFKVKYKNSVIENEQTQVELALAGLGLNEAEFDNHIGYRVEEVINPYERIVDVTADKNYDIIIKMADKHEHTTGFSALDIHLIRQSAVPIWFTYNNIAIKDIKNIMIAVDPETIGHDVGTALTNALASFGCFLSQNTGARLHFVSCWHMDYDLVSNDMSFDSHKTELLGMIQNTKIDLPYDIVHLYGDPIKTLVDYIHTNNVDVLVLGTSNVLNNPNKEIGHTAEAIIDQVYCDMIVAKPIK